MYLNCLKHIFETRELGCQLDFLKPNNIFTLGVKGELIGQGIQSQVFVPRSFNL